METETKSPERWPGVIPNRDEKSGRFVSGPIGNVEERFWNKVDKSGGCWIWKGTAVPRGYGRLTHKGRGKYAHRFAYELTHGPIPTGLRVLHRCDEPRCVRPDHLFLGTQKDNLRDASQKKRLRFGSRNPQAKLTEADVAQIRSLLRKGARPVRVALRFGVSYALIRKIRRGELWPEN